jgi:glycine hydroxymethyltransferase
MQLNVALREQDPEIASLISSEFNRQKTSINLIASENFAPQAVLDAVGSVLTNKYAEGYPGARYYGGAQFVDQIERLCQSRALELFGLDPSRWGVNVQALSGSPANFAVYSALLEPNERLMALDLPHGGHLSHGYQTDSRKVSMVSKFWQSMPYRLDPKTGLIDYDECGKYVQRFRPKLVVCGASSYARTIDFEKFRKVADSVNAILMCDMAHIAGLVAGQVHPSPFDYADVVTTTTHKTLRGPRGALIFYRKGMRPAPSTTEFDFERRINLSVFPGLQGGPHQHTIAGIAVALKMANSPAFREYQSQVVKNCQTLVNTFQKSGIDMVSGGSDNHLILVDLRSRGLSGNQVEKLCELVNISLNKNTVPGDKSAINPSGLRVGTPAMTSRGLVESDFQQVGEYIVRVIGVAERLVKQGAPKNIAEFMISAKSDIEVQKLKIEIEQFANKFETIGRV